MTSCVLRLSETGRAAGGPLTGDAPLLQPLTQPLSVFEGLWSRAAILPLSDDEIGRVLAT